MKYSSYSRRAAAKDAHIWLFLILCAYKMDFFLMLLILVEINDMPIIYPSANCVSKSAWQLHAYSCYRADGR